MTEFVIGFFIGYGVLSLILDVIRLFFRSW